MDSNKTTQNAQNVANNQNLTTCKACGAAIAKSARICPSCGAKNKKKPVGLIVAIILIAVIGAYVFITTNLNAAKATLTTSDGVSMTWNEYKKLYHEYYLNGNSVEFMNEYTPATAVVSGKITEISNAIIGETLGRNSIPTDTTMMQFTMNIDDKYEYYVTYKYYDEADYDFSHLKVGDKVTVRGTFTSEYLFRTNIIEEHLNDPLKIDGTLLGITKE